jgi:hypothetical protein
MKEADSEKWLPVKKVPSQAHVDLLANNMYVCVPHTTIDSSPSSLCKTPSRLTTPTKLTNSTSPKNPRPLPQYQRTLRPMDRRKVLALPPLIPLPS